MHLMSRLRIRSRFMLVVAIYLLALTIQLGLVSPTAASALSPSVCPPNCTFVVNTLNDTHDANTGNAICADSTNLCSLRAAVEQADALLAGSIITITVPAGTYNLDPTLGTLNLTANTITINGAGSNATIISGNNTFTIMSVSSGVKATLNKLTITNGYGDASPTGIGGGIYNDGKLTVNNCILSNNTATSNGNGLGGGGIYNDGSGILTVKGSTFSGNLAYYGYGGGIENFNKLTVKHSTFSNNKATFFGGGIYNGPAGQANIYGNSLFSGNSGVNGGGIYNLHKLTVTDSTITNSSAYFYGGGIYNEGGTLTLSYSTLKSNSANYTGPQYGGYGGGIYNTNNSTVTVSHSTLDSNSAINNSNNNGGNGGGIYNTGSTLTVTYSTISNNTASNGTYHDGGLGGGIYNDSTLTVQYSTLTGNSAPFFGGGIYNEFSGTVTVSTSTFTGNAANDSGGLAWGGGIANKGMLTVSTSTFTGNSAMAGGGAIINYGTANVSTSTFTGNTAAWGGAIKNHNILNVNNSTFTGNSADGAAILNNGGTTTVNYSTISNNSGTQVENLSMSVTLTGTIVANSPWNCGGTITDGGFNLDSGVSCGFHLLSDFNSTAPLLGPLANNGGPTQTMALLQGSPIIDKGSTSCPATDQRGMTRPDPNDGDTTCDIGAYESYHIL